MILSLDRIPVLGQSIASRLREGCPLFLSGPLGVGKTTLARSIIQVLSPGISFVPSPSFPLLIPYPVASGFLWHGDLYRIRSPKEIPSLGLVEYMEESLCLVEWPEALGEYCPPSFWRCTLSFTERESCRRITFSDELQKALPLDFLMEKGLFS